MGILVCGQCKGICSKLVIVNDERRQICEQCWHNDKMREKIERREKWQKGQQQR